MSTMHSLTGRTRYRTYRPLFSSNKLVLQVEVHVKGYHVDHYLLSNDIDYKYWRDATVEDVTMEMRNDN